MAADIRQVFKQRRRQMRDTSGVLGKVLFDDREYACRILNWTEAGANLEVVSTRDIPDRIEFRIDSLRWRTVAAVRWRNTEVLGVEFETPAA